MTATRGGGKAPGAVLHVGRGRLLLVGGASRLRDVMRQGLHRHGFHVLVASSGVEALAILTQEPLCLVVSELALPDMSGVEVRDLAHDRGVVVPFLFLGTRGVDPDAADKLSAGDDVLHGAPTLDGVVRRIRAVLGDDRAGDG